LIAILVKFVAAFSFLEAFASVYIQFASDCGGQEYQHPRSGGRCLGNFPKFDPVRDVFILPNTFDTLDFASEK